jgi:hypothetical protein
MNLFAISNSVRQIWEDRPDIVALLVLGFAVFGYVVLDAWRYRQRDKHKHQRKY